MSKTEPALEFEATFKGQLPSATFVLVVSSVFTLVAAVALGWHWKALCCLLPFLLFMGVIPWLHAYRDRSRVVAYFRVWEDRFEWQKRGGQPRSLSRADVADLTIINGFDCCLVFDLHSRDRIDLNGMDFGIDFGSRVNEYLYENYPGVVYVPQDSKRPGGTLEERKRASTPLR